VACVADGPKSQLVEPLLLLLLLLHCFSVQLCPAPAHAQARQPRLEGELLRLQLPLLDAALQLQV